MKLQFKKIMYLPLVLIGFITLTAGHHFETKLAQKYPALDTEDIFVFESENKDKTVLILSLNPQAKPNAENNFAENGIYSFHIGFNKEMSNGMSLNFKFSDGKVQMYHANQAVAPMGYVGQEMGSGSINKTLNFDNGITLWTGTSKDPFHGSALGIGPFKEAAGEGKFDLSKFDVGQEGNIFGAMHSAVIAVEIPNKYLPENIYYFASTAVMEKGEDHWHGVNSIAHVLFPHMYMEGDSINTRKNQSRNIATPELRDAVVSTIKKYTTLSEMKENPKAYAEKIADMVMPDIMSYKVGSEAKYAIDNLNGRKLSDDAMDVALAILIGSDTPVSDQVEVLSENYQTVFPYVIPVDDAFTKNTSTTESVVSKVTDFGYKQPVVKEDTNDSLIKENNAEDKSSNLLYYILGGLALLAILLFIFRKIANRFDENNFSILFVLVNTPISILL